MRKYRITAVVETVVDDDDPRHAHARSLDEPARRGLAADFMARLITNGFLGGAVRDDESLNITVEALDG